MLLSPETTMLIAKPIASGGIAGLIDAFYFKNGMRANLVFAGTVGGAVFLADMIAKASPVHAGHATHVAKSLEARALELGLATTGALAFDTYMVQSFSSSDAFDRFISIAASEALGEYVANSFLLIH